MSYWRGNATQPARIAQFTSSGFKNVMPVYMRSLDRAPCFAQQLSRAKLGIERFGWDRPADDLVLLPDGQDRDDLVAATCARCCAVPVLLPAWGGWTTTTRPIRAATELASRLNPAHPPDWRWRVKPLLDDRAATASARARSGCWPIDDAAVEAKLADPATSVDGAADDRGPPPARAGPAAQRPADAVPRQLRARAVRPQQRTARSMRSTRCTRRSATRRRSCPIPK